MSVIDEVLEANEIYSSTHELRKLTPRPERSLAVLTCMDTRLAPKKSNPAKRRHFPCKFQVPLSTAPRWYTLVRK